METYALSPLPEACHSLCLSNNSEHLQLGTFRKHDEWGLYYGLYLFNDYALDRAIVIAASLAFFFQKINTLFESGYLSYSITMGEKEGPFNLHHYFEHTIDGVVTLVTKGYFDV